ncbi:uncharacterized protein BJ212DRAFT_1410335 [Suillus subaureus]|uniref:Uncharacterized protein n=1 Tax=Suillus subaureus TaxID=48587 RepID=A0A9P7ASC1_9AGAM|nr:uncharacterized protein BJ212DRAFT_1410335 [Suillus subaureus]KAG1795580.1 hypothetical protein BJ212DRAFT_1410335 [Suillus subaureus]
MMWYALGYEKVDTTRFYVMLEDKWRTGWLERMEQRESRSCSISSSSLPRLYTRLLPVKLPPTDNILFISPAKPSRSRKEKEKPNLIIPSISNP